MELAPYLMFDGNCEEAMNFYAKALDGKINHLSRYKDAPMPDIKEDEKERVMHASLSAKGINIMASDAGPGSENISSGGPVHLCLSFDNAKEEEKIYNNLKEGGTVTMPLQDTFWGATYGMLTDKFGINWMLNFAKPQNAK